MQDRFKIKIARRLPFLRAAIMRGIYRSRDPQLDELISYAGGRFFHYRFGKDYVPAEGLRADLSMNSLLEKCRNESLWHYQPGPCDTIIDLGAGLGEEALAYSRYIADTGRIYSIEAHPRVYEVLCRTIALNRLNNCLPLLGALCPDGKVARIRESGDSYEAGFISGDGIEVPSISLAGLIASEKRIDLLKANIEGAERFLVEQLAPEHTRKVRHVAVACHDFRANKEGNEFFRTRQLVRDFLAEQDFEIFSRDTGTDYLDDWIYASNKNPVS
jgi:FkbM family methyltransferase